MGNANVHVPEEVNPAGLFESLRLVFDTAALLGRVGFTKVTIISIFTLLNFRGNGGVHKNHKICSVIFPIISVISVISVRKIMGGLSSKFRSSKFQ